MELQFGDVSASGQRDQPDQIVLQQESAMPVPECRFAKQRGFQGHTATRVESNLQALAEPVPAS